MTALDKPDVGAKIDEAQEKKEKVEMEKKHDKVDDSSLEDVYDPISDDELEAIIADEKQENKIKEKIKTLDIEDVDWSVLEGKSEKSRNKQLNNAFSCKLHHSPVRQTFECESH